MEQTILERKHISVNESRWRSVTRAVVLMRRLLRTAFQVLEKNAEVEGLYLHGYLNIPLQPRASVTGPLSLSQRRMLDYHRYETVTFMSMHLSQIAFQRALHRTSAMVLR